MNLFEIDNEILKCVDEETGEIIDIEKLDALEEDRDKKVENIALWIKNLKAESEELKKEKMNFAARQRSAENKMESLKKYLSSYLNGQKFSTSKVVVSFRKSKSVEVNDMQALMEFSDEYIKYTEPTADKIAIKDAIERGIDVPGVELVASQNIQIK